MSDWCWYQKHTGTWKWTKKNFECINFVSYWIKPYTILENANVQLQLHQPKYSKTSKMTAFGKWCLFIIKFDIWYLVMIPLIALMFFHYLQKIMHKTIFPWWLSKQLNCQNFSKKSLNFRNWKTILLNLTYPWSWMTL